MSRLEFACTLAYPGGFTLEAAFTTDADLTLLSGPSGSGKTSILSLIAGLADRSVALFASAIFLFLTVTNASICRRNSGVSAMCFKNTCCFRT